MLNLEINYLAGINVCFFSSLLLTLIVFATILFQRFYLDRYNPPVVDFFTKDLLLIFIYFLGCVISFLLVLYPFINLFNQSQPFFTLYQGEITRGTLALRITSVLLGFKFLKGFYNFYQDKYLEVQNQLIAEYHDLNKLSYKMNENTINFLISTQNIIYGAVTFIIWIFVIFYKDRTSLASLMSWGLFFIIDDWGIVCDNLIALKGRTLKFHKYRILGFNIFLYILSLIVCFGNMSLAIAILISLILGYVVIKNTVIWLRGVSAD
ncbi:MAG: hypothetical protein KME21_23385 [Desmonostoc vinosum HA7617-LM4]|jgi:hypothetical protein|nr:hypothetical protein [Desmonostoc vinosum HA7617-LM4]